MVSIKEKACLIAGFFCFAFSMVSGQDQKLADSLIGVYNSGSFAEDELDLLSKIVLEETNPDIALEYSELLITKASKDSLINYLYQGYLQKGNSLKFKGNNAEALKAYFKSLEYSRRIGDEKGIGSLMISIAGTYTAMDNSNNAQVYFSQGIELLRKVNDSVKIATALLNAGDDYFNSGKLDSALIYTMESEVIFEKIDYSLGQAYGLGNLGMIYAEQEKDELAEQNIDKAISILEELEDYYPISVYLTYMSDIYLRKDNFPEALKYAERSLELATLSGLKEQISEANLKLSELHEANGDLATSYKYYKDHIT
ncbi:MAG: tetratricopeptide repeat protein, partial [Eudoraea sp.]|nr:tetratricopeptide repeat protein [Eudoraea sp.]